MKTDAPVRLRRDLTRLSEDELETFFEQSTPGELARLAYEWPVWARPEQVPPPGDWSTWAVMGGRGMGKTRTGAETLRAWKTKLSRKYGPVRLALVGKEPGDIRRVMIEGESGLLAISPPWDKPQHLPSLREVRWPDGSVAFVYSAEEPDSLRGPQHHAAWCDEVSKWKYPQETWDNLQFGLRLGDDPRVVATFTPRNIPTVRDILEDSSTVVTRGSLMRNRANLPDKFIRRVLERYQGTRLGRQEIQGELLGDTPGALWSMTMIEGTRVKRVNPAKLVRIIVGVDPGGSHKDDIDEDNDAELVDELPETGIVAVGRGEDGHAYVLHDASGNLSPAKWGYRTVKLWEDLKGDLVVGEINNGGEMVEYVCKTSAKELGCDVFFKPVRASRGKYTRAEPVAALYEQGRVHHVGMFPELEDQMTTWLPGRKSPDRMDALVWALTELMVLSPDDLIAR